MPECIMAYDGMVISKEGPSYTLRINDRLVDRFANYKDAADLATQLYISRCRNSDDEMIGQIKYVASAIDNGSNCVVVAKTKHGYLVQRIGGNRARIEVLPEYLLDPV